MHKYIKNQIIGSILMFPVIVLIFLNKLSDTKYLLISIFLYFTSLIFLFSAWLKHQDFYGENVLNSLKISKRYYSNLGYAFFTGGIVAFLTSDYKIQSIAIIIVGITFTIVGENKRAIIKRFKNLVNNPRK